MGNFGLKIKRKWTPKPRKFFAWDLYVQESLPLILMQVLVGLKKSNYLHGITLYPEISDL